MIHHRQEGGHHGSSCRDQKLISKCRCMSNTDSEGTAHLMSDFSDHFNRILMENGLGNSAQIWSDIPTEILCATLNWKWFFQCGLQYLKRCNPILKKPLSIKNILQNLERRTAWILPFSAGGFLNIGLFHNFSLLGSRGFDQQIIHGVSDLLDALLL